MTQNRSGDILFTHPRYNITPEFLTMLKYEMTLPFNFQSNLSCEMYLSQLIQQDLSYHTMFQKNVVNQYPILEIKYLEVITFPVSIDYILQHLSHESHNSKYKYLGDCFRDMCLLTHNARIFNKNNANTEDKCVELEEDVIKLINKFLQNFKIQQITDSYKFAKFSDFQTFQQIIFNTFPPGLIPNVFFINNEAGQRTLQNYYQANTRPPYREEIDELVFYFLKLSETSQTYVLTSLFGRINQLLDENGVLKDNMVHIELQNIDPQFYWWFQELVIRQYQQNFGDYQQQKQQLYKVRQQLMPYHNQYVNINEFTDKAMFDQLNADQIKIRKQAKLSISTKQNKPPKKINVKEKETVQANEKSSINLSQVLNTITTPTIPSDNQNTNLNSAPVSKIPQMQLLQPIQQLQTQQPQHIQTPPMQFVTVVQQKQPELIMNPILLQQNQDNYQQKPLIPIVPTTTIAPIQHTEPHMQRSVSQQHIQNPQQLVMNNTYNEKIQEFSSIHSPDDGNSLKQQVKPAKRKYVKKQNSNVSHMSDQQNSASILQNSLLATSNPQSTLQFNQSQVVKLSKPTNKQSQQISTELQIPQQDQILQFQQISMQPNQLLQQNQNIPQQTQIQQMQMKVQMMNKQFQNTIIKPQNIPQMQYIQPQETSIPQYSQIQSQQVQQQNIQLKQQMPKQQIQQPQLQYQQPQQNVHIPQMQFVQPQNQNNLQQQQQYMQMQQQQQRQMFEKNKQQQVLKQKQDLILKQEIMKQEQQKQTMVPQNQQHVMNIQQQVYTHQQQSIPIQLDIKQNSQYHQQVPQQLVKQNLYTQPANTMQIAQNTNVQQQLYQQQQQVTQQQVMVKQQQQYHMNTQIQQQMKIQQPVQVQNQQQYMQQNNKQQYTPQQNQIQYQLPIQPINLDKGNQLQVHAKDQNQLLTQQINQQHLQMSLGQKTKNMPAGQGTKQQHQNFSQPVPINKLDSNQNLILVQSDPLDVDDMDYNMYYDE